VDTKAIGDSDEILFGFKKWKEGRNKMKKEDGFTLTELLVVMVIMAVLAALLLPAIRKSRSKALIDKAKAEMAALASIETMVKMDCGYYVRLCDLAVADTTTTTVKVYGCENDLYTPDDSTDTHIDVWDGPYQVFQPKTTYQSDNGSHPADDTGTWDNLSSIAPEGTPLDPWGHTYLLAYNSTQKIMIIYSAGPNGTLETGKGATLVGDADADGDVVEAEGDYPNSDDLLYKFR